MHHQGDQDRNLIGICDNWLKIIILFLQCFYVNREDYEVAEQYDTQEKKDEFYVRMKSGAETGWDFSSRWFIASDGSERGEYILCLY